MAILRRLLDDESVAVSTRTHAKALLGPLLVLIMLAAVAGVLSTFTPAAGRARPLLDAVVWGVTAVLALLWVLRPFLGWLTTTYTVTDQRLVTRRGLLSRHGHDIPLSQVGDVTYARGLLDRMLGCGTLVVSVAGEHRVHLHNVPHVERVHLTIQNLLHDGETTRVFRPDGRRHDDRH